MEHFPHGTVYLAPAPSRELESLLELTRHYFGHHGGVRNDHTWHLSVSRRGGADFAQGVTRDFHPVETTVNAASLWTQAEPGRAWTRRHESTFRNSGISSRSRSDPTLGR